MNSAQEMHEAIRRGDLDHVRALLDTEPGLLKGGGSSGMPPLMFAVYNRHMAIADLLIERGADVDLFAASALGRLDVVTEELKKNPLDLQAYSSDGWTPLHLASFFGAKDCAEYLIELGASPKVRSANTMCNTPLHAAAAGRFFDIVALLLSNGAEVDAKQHGGYTAMHSAAANGDIEVVRLLLAHQAQSGVRAENGKSPLDMAKDKEHTAVIELLGGM